LTEKKRIKISPSILTADFGRLGDFVAELTGDGADMIHLDVIDGQFAPTMTFGPPMVKALRRHTHLPLDVHIMVNTPERIAGAFIEAGADFLTFHAEATIHAHRVVQQIRAQGAKAGVAVNPGTPPEAIAYLLPDIDLVLVMTVNPGFGGQKLIPQTLTKVKILRSWLDEINPDAEVMVDGGINERTAPHAIEAGATMLVAGSSVCDAPDKAEMIRRLRGGNEPASKG
jgi:ribulose-phosphate 3-epimerase